MTVNIYASTEASSPVLDGNAASLNNVLHACLVTGYGSRDAAGWTRDYYDATSQTAVFRPGAGPRHYLQSQDNGPGAGTTKEARWRGYVSMSNYNTGTEPFPTTAQMANGLFVRKSTATGTTARAWRLVADATAFALFIDPGDTSGVYSNYLFGQFDSWKPSDAYATIIAARVVENAATITSTQSPQSFAHGPTAPTVCAYAPRSYSGVGSAVTLAFHHAYHLVGSYSAQILGGSGSAYPHPVDGGIVLSSVTLSEGTITRGKLRGIAAPCHARPLVMGDTFSALDGATTRDYIAQNLLTTGQVVLETSQTWDI